MAQHASDDIPTRGNDYAEHEKTYQRFVWLTTRATAALVVVLVVMAIALV